MTGDVERVAVSRVTSIGGREATFFENATLRVQIDDIGGMAPIFCSVQDKRQINAHWQPWFRSNSGRQYNDSRDGSFWKSEYLYNVAGSFPCAPNFGPAHIIDGFTMPPNGWTANLKWNYKKSGVDEASGAAWALSELKSPDLAMPLSFKKTDAVLPKHSVHYSALSINNLGVKDIEICCANQNIIAPPFLQEGCCISAAANIWTTPPPGGEFDLTTRLALGSEFASLSKAPLTYGGKIDLSVIPYPSGYTDFVTGAIPKTARLGWSSVVNPRLKMAYICFFPGPAALLESEAVDDIILYFNGLAMHYGGRHFTPWAPWDGAPDQTYCLGLQNAAAAYSYGLDYSRKQKKVLDAPATVTIPAGAQKTLYYGCLLAAYEKNILDGGIVGVDAEESQLVCKSATESWKFDADALFRVIRAIHRNNQSSFAL
ncbi:MAG: hypothetical protein LBC27_01430 [Spirochaetaceae bacterium]|jgi:hypothetical protein|nr:hypothetical protein [Spirochaetaceae bacterium]